MNERLFFNHWRDNRGSSNLAPTFDNQERLLELLLAHKDYYLIPDGINVLTMRLLFVQDAFHDLRDFELAIKKTPGDYELDRTIAGTVASTYSLIPINRIGETYNFEAIKVHEYFYAFLTSIVSVLDRLANEINHLYELNIQKVGWRDISGKFSALGDKNPELLKYLIANSRKHNGTIKLLLDYRDVAEHEGIVKIEIIPNEDKATTNVTITEAYGIKIRSNPRDENSPLNESLVKTSTDFFNLVTNICNGTYGLVISDLTTPDSGISGI